MNIVSENWTSGFKIHQLINKKSDQDLLFVKINHKITRSICCVEKLFIKVFLDWWRMFRLDPHYCRIIFSHVRSSRLNSSRTNENQLPRLNLVWIIRNLNENLRGVQLFGRNHNVWSRNWKKIFDKTIWTKRLQSSLINDLRMMLSQLFLPISGIIVISLLYISNNMKYMYQLSCKIRFYLFLFTKFK